MSTSARVSAAQEEALDLHRRLLAGDPTASNDLAVAYLQPLAAWLSEIKPDVSPDDCMQAAGDALLALIRNPESYAPELQTLEVYLRMSARGDLLNLIAKELRQTAGLIPLSSVEDSPDAGKYLGHTEDPAAPLCIAEEMANVVKPVLDSVCRELSAADHRAVELILQNERRTAVFAEVYELTHLPAAEQRRAVKRHKDRLKAMLKRFRRKA